MKIRGIDFVWLTAKDIPQAIAFYRDILGLPLNSEESGSEWTEFAVEPGLALTTGQGFGPLALAVEDIFAAVEELQGQGIEFRPSYNGISIVESRVCYYTGFRDPFGITLWLHQRKDGSYGSSNPKLSQEFTCSIMRIRRMKKRERDKLNAVAVPDRKRGKLPDGLLYRDGKIICEKDEAEMMRIPAGEFKMGSSDGEDHEKPVHTVYLDAFYIDKYPVTNAQYRRFVEETEHPEPKYWGEVKTTTHHDAEFDILMRANHPVVGISWYDAMAYCEWVGKCLPTEAEWEKAARGTDGRTFPWGNKWHSQRCSNDLLQTGDRDTTPVDQYPSGASPYGVMDLAGNVWEWCLDAYDKDFYVKSPKNNPFSGGDISDVVNNFVNVKSQRVVRGGTPRVAARYSYGPGNWYIHYGFRCVCPRFP